jgi:hypothetical protein
MPRLLCQAFAAAPMSKDFADFLAALNKEGVDYVVIGGIAVQAHVMYRFTRDIDVLVRPTLDNARKVRTALGHWAGATPPPRRPRRRQ